MLATIFVAMVWHCESLGKPAAPLQFDDVACLATDEKNRTNRVVD